ncbi:hypothetical protein EI94DRAFT_1799736 [Lactarius quietus]|nr:hypothetical protein EI94DRAFT_1799736 [Lactarius quietus]
MQVDIPSTPPSSSMQVDTPSPPPSSPMQVDTPSPPPSPSSMRVDMPSSLSPMQVDIPASPLSMPIDIASLASLMEIDTVISLPMASSPSSSLKPLSNYNRQLLRTSQEVEDSQTKMQVDA